jgi:hypothetical protein
LPILVGSQISHSYPPDWFSVTQWNAAFVMVDADRLTEATMITPKMIS